MYFDCFCAADGALRIDISVHERNLENMAKGKRLFLYMYKTFITNNALCLIVFYASSSMKKKNKLSKTFVYLLL